MHKRIEREKRIINLMITDYCKLEHHNENELCPTCTELVEYAEKRLLACPFLENKPVCSKCSIHCYNKQKKEEIKNVMRTVGPKMIYKYPKDTIWYLFYKFIHSNQRIA